jgi:hypothetical protein
MKDTFDIHAWNKKRYLYEDKELLSEGGLTNYYSRSNKDTRLAAEKVDDVLQQLNPSEEQLEALVRLITDLADEYAQEYLDNFEQGRI